MKFNVGDKVKFLNEKGGGIVSRIISPVMVNVMVEEGFEIPMMTSDLIKVDPKGRVESMFDEDFNVRLKETGKVPPNSGHIPANKAGSGKGEGGDPNSTRPDEPERVTPLVNRSFLTKNTPGVYLALVPHDQKWLVTGDVEVFLVNHTPFNVLFILFHEEEEEIIGRDYDVIFPDNKILLGLLDREELLNWTRGIAQLIFHDEKPDKVFNPVSTSFDISLSRLNNEDSYIESQFLEEKALLVSLVQLTALIPVISREESHKDEQVVKKQKAMEVRPGSLIEQHQTGLHEAVVDLHIDELLDDYKRMTPQEILKYQIDYFKKCIESAVEKNFRKVTFIHGVGNGTLKNAIIKKVKDYEQMENHLASLAKFGVGAIDVVIKPYK